MENVLNFNDFIFESEGESQPFYIDHSFLSKISKDSHFLKSVNDEGNVRSIGKIKDHITGKEGFEIILNVKDIEDLLESLDEDSYYISPNWVRGGKIILSFLPDKNMEAGKFKIEEQIPSDARYGYGDPKTVITIGGEKYEEFLRGFDDSIKEISKIFSVIKVTDYSNNYIPHDISKEIRTKIKEVYASSIKKFFKDGDIDPELNSIYEIILDIFKGKKEFPHLQNLPKEVTREILKGSVEKSPSDFIKDIKHYSRISKMMRSGYF